MTENVSMSRYSIVERLVTTKMMILEQKHQIEGEIVAKKVRIKQTEMEWQKEKLALEKDIKEKEKMYDQQINFDKESIVKLEAGKSSKAKLCDDKIKEIDKAMEALQEISKSSMEEAKK